MPLGQGIQGTACQQEVGEQQAQHGSRREGRRASGQGGQVALVDSAFVHAMREGSVVMIGEVNTPP